MSSIITESKSESKSKKVPFNTTIDENIRNNFRIYCNQRGIPMNVLIERFMEQLLNKEIELKFVNSNITMSCNIKTSENKSE